MSVPTQECTFHVTCTERTETMYLCLVQLLFVQWQPPSSSPTRQNVMISCKHECMGEALELLTQFLFKCIRFDDCNVYFQLSNF